MKKINKKSVLKKIIIFSWLLVSFIVVFSVKAQNDKDYSDQADAIAIKVIPNPNHYSISTWYSNQGFVGSPQSLIVDGYEAIRDGRTVYVNAANVSGNNIYTNIYVISYTQQPSEKTIDILGQIVSRWEFNDGLNEDLSEGPNTCTISSYTCDSDKDCSKGQYCSEEGETIGTCLLEDEKNCLTDDDCPSGYFCNSPKAIVVRDTKRIGMLEEMKTALSNYRQRNGSYPTFSAGTYLENKSVSVWPSWKEKFLPEIAMSPTYVDTINRIGNCPGFDKDTCWNVEERKFWSESNYQSLELPDNSYVMVYAVNEEGSEYNLCASLETSKIGLSFTPGDYTGEACQTNFTASGGTGENVSPELVDFYLESQAGKDLNGYIRVKDLNKDNLEWSLDTSMSDWSDWSSAPRLIDTSSTYEKKIYAQKTGNNTSGPYIVKVNVTDGEGGFYEEEFEIEIKEPGIYIEAENARHTLKVGVPFKYSLYFSGSTLPENIEDIDYKISTTTSPSIDVSNFIELDAPVFEKVGINKYKLSYEGYIDPDDYQNDEFAEDVRLGFEALVYDKDGREFSKEFYIDIISPKPPLDFSCPLTTRIRTDDSVSENNYSCNIGKKEYLGGEIEYFLSGLGLDNLGIFEFSDGIDPNAVYLKGYAENIVVTSADIIAKSPYGATNKKKIFLEGVSYCGDGILNNKEANTEGKGGVYNDGYEQCERGGQGLAKSAQKSDVNKQYGCTIANDTPIPLEISTNNYCTFKGYLSGGGYCGDYYCQAKYETIDNCGIDCLDENTVENPDYCEEDGNCESGFICSEEIHECVESPRYCENDDDCENGLECPEDGNECTELCWEVRELVSTVNFLGGDATRADKTYNHTKKGHEIVFTTEQINAKALELEKPVSVKCKLDGDTVERCFIENGKEKCKESETLDCTYVNLNDPRCSYNNSVASPCPLGYGDEDPSLYGYTGEDDHCIDVSGMFDSYEKRPKYNCEAYKIIKRCYGDSCRIGTNTHENGIMNEEGECVDETTFYGIPYKPVIKEINKIGNSPMIAIYFEQKENSEINISYYVISIDNEIIKNPWNNEIEKQFKPISDDSSQYDYLNIHESDIVSDKAQIGIRIKAVDENGNESDFSVLNTASYYSL